MTLTVSPEIVLLLIACALLAWAIMLLRGIAQTVGMLATHDSIVKIRHNQELYESARIAHDDAIIRGDKAILDIAKANNEALKMLVGAGGVMDAGKHARIKRALQEAIEYAEENGVDPGDLGVADLMREMGEDRP